MPNKQETGATQQFIEIESIEDDTIKLKSGSLRKILLVSGINFSLKSEEEQGLILYAFQGFLNSLNFSVQFSIHSRKLNVDDYLTKLEERESAEPNQLLKNQILEYREFVRTLVTQNAIMQKRFFVTVPFDPIQIPKAGLAMAERALSWFKKTSPAENKTKTEESNKEHLEQLGQRVDQVISGLNQIGLRAVPLNNDELIELFYNLYNPTTVEKKINLEIEKN